ncbi:MAG: MBL fold metallo-hydrolase [Paludibacteraceae bacterium]|nr:MBL fold metallo-hydrolase [Paludibacteraceae bacterium]
MKITILGSGTSTGVPYLNCGCEVCRSKDPHDARLRCSALVEYRGRTLLIDCGPDFRQQMLRRPTPQIDAVLFTHEHYDHVAGIDDLRPYGNVRLYAEERVCSAIRRNLPYCFAETHYPGAPRLELHTIDLKPFTAAGIEIQPIRCYHAQLPIVGYRIGPMAYLTDISRIDDDQLPLLDGLEVLIIDALRQTPHFSHYMLTEAQALATRLGVRRCYFTHICHQMGLHAAVNSTLPEGQALCYDGMEIQLGD